MTHKKEKTITATYDISRRSFVFGAGALAIGAALGITGCSSGAAGTAASGTAGSAATTTGGELSFGCTNFSKESIDPTTVTNAAWACGRYGVGEGLFKFDEKMNPVEHLCDKYEVDDAHLNWTFHIRDDAKFSTGEAVTPTKVKECFEYYYEKEPSGSTPFSKYMQVESMTADDATNSLTIVTPRPYASLPSELATPYFYVLDVKGSTNMDEKPIGTGPYAVEEFDGTKQIVLAKNEYYWKGEVPFDKLNILFIDDSSSLTKTMALQANNVDITENITATSDLEQLRNDANYHVSETISMRSGISHMNQKGVLGNKELRAAILQAIDFDTICEKTVGGMYTAGCSVIPSSLDYNYDKLTNPYPYDVEAAKKRLDDAGIVDSDGDGYRELDGKMIDLKYVTYDSRNLATMVTAIASQLEEIGIKVTVNNTDADSEWNSLVAGDYDLNSSNWMTAQDGDPSGYLANWHSGDEANYCGYSNPDFDKDYEALQEELDIEKRKEIITRLQQYIIDDAAMVVHGYYHSNFCSNAQKVTGADIHTADYYWITSDIKPLA